tara:strand:- start:56 stop:1687 length:1632 start_codon:yes stop_codon:yes gene_type:complete
MVVRLLITLVVLLNLETSNAETICIQDIPNPGDSTCTTTYSTGTAATTNNIISQTFNDGSWNGTMFPDSSDLNEANILTGKHGKYAETTVSSNDLLTEAEIQQGFTSNFNAEIRWWNSEESTVTMYQYATNGNDTINQTIILEDTTNHNYQYNNYGNTLIVGSNAENTHGTLTAGFSFDIQGNVNYNGGHAGVDVTDPTLTIDYTALTTATSTAIQYCWQKNPPTCPGQDEIEEVTTIIEDFEDNFELIFEDIETIAIDVPDNLVIPEFIWEPEEVTIEEPQFEIYTVDVIPMENIEVMSIDMPEPEMPTEEFNTEDISNAYDMETNVETSIASEPEPTESNTDTIEIVEQPNEPIEEQPSSAEVIADKPIQETNDIKQEEVVEAELEESGPEPTEEPIEQDIVEVIEEEPVAEEQAEVIVDVVKVENYIDSKVKNQIERVEATLVVVNELVSRAMVSNQVDISSYATMNTAIFDNRQLPDGNPDFFKQVVLAGYDKSIYNNQVTLGSIDPVAQHNIKVNTARNKTNKAYLKLQELMNERNDI